MPYNIGLYQKAQNASYFTLTLVLTEKVVAKTF